MTWKYRRVFHIPLVIKTQNYFLPGVKATERGVRANYAKYRKYRGEFYDAMNAEMGMLGHSVEHFQFVSVISERYRTIDHWNLYGGGKPIPDTLTKLGWIKDDAPKWATIYLAQQKVRKKLGEEEGTWIFFLNDLKPWEPCWQDGCMGNKFRFTEGRAEYYLCPFCGWFRKAVL